MKLKSVSISDKNSSGRSDDGMHETVFLMHANVIVQMICPTKSGRKNAIKSVPRLQALVIHHSVWVRLPHHSCSWLVSQLSLAGAHDVRVCDNGTLVPVCSNNCNKKQQNGAEPESQSQN